MGDGAIQVQCRCNEGTKVNFFHSLMDYFPDNLGAVREKQGDRKGIKGAGMRACWLATAGVWYASARSMHTFREPEKKPLA